MIWKLLLIFVFVIGAMYVMGLFPPVAVAITAISIVCLFLMFKEQ